MDIKYYKQGIKKRRDERLRLLREKKRKFGTSHTTPIPTPRRLQENQLASWSEHSQEYSYRYSSSDYGQSLKVILRIICSLVLVTGVYFVMRSESPQIVSTQSFIQEVMNRDFNVQGVVAWYEKNLGTKPAFLPQIIKREDEGDIEHQREYVVPVNKGLVVSTFNQDQQGIMIKTANQGMPIEGVKEGWVVFVGEKEGLGQTVIIDHRNGEESWYGQLKDVQVLLHDWVDQGEIIGYSGSNDEENNQGVFYFALKKDSVFIDPLGVIPFD